MFSSLSKKYFLTILLAASVQAVIAETVRLRPLGSEIMEMDQALLSSEVDSESQVVLLNEAKKMREEGINDKALIQDLQEKLRESYTALERESTKAAYRGIGRNGEIAISEWNIDPVKSLRENMTLWRLQAERNTQQSIPFVWNLPGPVELTVPAVFYGNWRDALWQLSLAFKQNGWDIKIDIAKTNNVVIFDQFDN